MSIDPWGPLGWARDIAIAYAAGLAVGAPFALIAVWLTGRERASTVCFLLAMTGVLVVLRRSTDRRFHRNPTPNASRQPEVTGRAA